MARRVVVTGGGGFVGQWLARALLARGDNVILAGLGDRPTTPAILTKSEWGEVRWIPCDVRRDSDVRDLVDDALPDLIIHLAGMSLVPAAEKAPIVAYEVNVLGAVRVASAASHLRASGKADPLLLVAGSAAQYGAHPASEMPLSESAPQRPMNVYAATKAAQEMAVLQIGRASGLRVVCTRSFNHSGVGQDSAFLLPGLAKQVQLARKSAALPIGNDVIRDYLHVDDVVDAYLALADRGVPGEVYNVCSGVGLTVRQLAAEVLRRAGVNATVASETELQRASDTPVLIGSGEKLKRTTGWAPRKSYTDIIDDLLAAS